MSQHYSLVLRNNNSLAERLICTLTIRKFWITCLASIILLMALSLTLSRTILSKWLNPHHIEQANKKMIVDLLASLGELELKNSQQEKLIELIQSAILGNDVSLSNYTNTNKAQLANKISGLEENASNDEINSMASINEDINSENILIMPVRGTIVHHYNKNDGNYGVEFSCDSSTSISCIANGTVVLSSFTLEHGYVLIVQHNKGLISIYKSKFQPLKKTGETVCAGEAIATINDSTLKKYMKTSLYFELWDNGHSLNPEDYITL